MNLDIRNLSDDAKFAFACFLVAEIHRHQKDIEEANLDLIAMRDMGIDVKRAYDMGFVKVRQ